jgi:HSP20 family molecular chaperone IbpA
MVKGKEVTGVESGSVQQEPERMLRPPVDISEDAEGITLVADMPGVNSDRLDVHVDNDTLLIEGQAKIDMPEGMEPLYADVHATHYRRSFALSSELDTTGIDASLDNGVLSVRIPKRAEVKPRKIEVRAG